MDCRHCGDPIVPTAAGWGHAHHLMRCQRPGRPYGYEAAADDGAPCECWACLTYGPTSPAANAPRTGYPGDDSEGRLPL